MRWQVEIDLGVGPLMLGMRPEEVASILNIIEKVKINSQEIDGSIFEYRSHNLPICYYKDNKLWHISLRSEVGGANIGDIELFSADSKSTLQKLFILAGEVRAYEEMLIFHSLGITTRGYIDPKSLCYSDPSSSRDSRAVGVSNVDVLRETIQGHSEFVLP